MSDKKKTPLTDVQGIPVLLEQGFPVTRPDYMNALPWIERERLGWEKFKQACAEKGLPEPTPREWAETFILSDGELSGLLALTETQIGDMAELDGYFVVRKLGNKPRICWRDPGQALGQMTFGDFHNAYHEKSVSCGYDDNGVPKFAPMTKVWLNRRKTPRFTTAKFLPGKMPWELDSDTYNIWTGWPEGLPRERDLEPPLLGRVVEDDEWDGPKEPAECSLFLDHMRHNMCQDDDETYEYFLGWMAEGLLRPGRSQVAVAMTGPSGSGKGTFATLYGSFFGVHYLPVSDKERLVGKFNRQLMEMQLVFGDEVDFSTADEATKKLRSLVTEEKLQIEFKGIDPTTERKWFRIMISSNEKHIVSALKDDRRYLVLYVDSHEHNDDEEGYFKPMREQWEAGGRVALFRWLTGRYWAEMLKQGGWKVGDRPETEALQEQKVASLRPVEEVIQAMLAQGEPQCPYEYREIGRDETRVEQVFVPTQLLGEKARLDPKDVTKLGRLLGMLADGPSVKEMVGPDIRRQRCRGFWLRDLASCRKRWDKHLGWSVDWPTDITVWGKEPEPTPEPVSKPEPEPEIPF